MDEGKQTMSRKRLGKYGLYCSLALLIGSSLVFIGCSAEMLDAIAESVEEANKPAPAPTQKEVIIPLSERIILYRVDNTFYTGDFRGRGAIDNLCRNSRNRPSWATHAHGFISRNVTPGDAIIDMPDNYGIPTSAPIVGPNGATIANNWDDLLDGNIATSLDQAGVLEYAKKWWSGSKANGTMRATCGEWTMTSGASGAQGDSSVTSVAWIEDGRIPLCTDTGQLLCVGW
ncbi:hypothetical protein U14_04137 [Candidatus Moduliflexus flocculans]|uniref:DUF1554 domain-containing protein n=1 Tax=Candidatus Moduliflexus flocculans TaxID=1499966 RepID=A0A0S6W039_9BACT|nr:hypothetical protein U14_04137 [Candidatus Moduliflexus flocculans]